MHIRNNTIVHPKTFKDSQVLTNEVIFRSDENELQDTALDRSEFFIKSAIGPFGS